jgi:hypothetical protein
MYVGVTVWFGWGGVVSLCRLRHCFSLHKDTTPPQPNHTVTPLSLHKDTATPQPNHTVTPTHIEPEQNNPWNKSTISSKLLKMDVLTSETRWAVNSEIKKQVTSSWCIFKQHKGHILKQVSLFAEEQHWQSYSYCDKLELPKYHKLQIKLHWNKSTIPFLNLTEKSNNITLTP